VSRAVECDGNTGRVPVGGRRFGPWKRSLLTKRLKKWSWRLSGVEAAQSARVAQRRVCEGALPSADTGEATETSEVRSHRRRGRKMPTPVRDGSPPVYAPMPIHQSGLGDVNHRFLRIKFHGSQGSWGESQRRKAFAASGNTRDTGQRLAVRMAEIGRHVPCWVTLRGSTAEHEPS
jgi:hypothetical protein